MKKRTRKLPKVRHPGRASNPLKADPSRISGMVWTFVKGVDAVFASVTAMASKRLDEVLNSESVENSYVLNPFVSEAQRRACYAAHDPDWDCGEWESVTSSAKLPVRVSELAKRERKGVDNEDDGMMMEAPMRLERLTKRREREMRMSRETVTKIMRGEATLLHGCVEMVEKELEKCDPKKESLADADKLVAMGQELRRRIVDDIIK